MPVEFPLILPACENFSAYHGYLKLTDTEGQSHEYWVRIDSLPDSASLSLRGARFSCDDELRKLLANLHGDVVQARLADSPTLENFLQELQEVAGRLLRAQPPPALPPPAFYSTLVTQLDAVGWESLESLSKDLSTLRLRCKDAANRVHLLELHLPPTYPLAPPTAVADLPEALPLRWQPEAGLKGALDQFRAFLEGFQDLWNCLDDLDANAWVLEPGVGGAAAAFADAEASPTMVLPSNLSFASRTEEACNARLADVYFL
eukprot:gene17696-21082_t